MYQNCVLTYSDMDYVEACVKNVLNSLYQDSTGSLVLGSVAIPTPPANVGKEHESLYHCKGQLGLFSMLEVITT